jgi:hypothetical protein
VYTKNNCNYNFEAYALNFLAPGTFGPGTGGFYVTKSGPGCGRVQLFQDTNPLTGDPVPAAGAWTHVVFCIDNSNIYLYINGRLNNSLSHSIVWDYDVNNKDVILGNTNESFTQSFKGSMDNLRFHDRCLNIDEIYSLYKRNPGCADDWRVSNAVGINSHNYSNPNLLSQNSPNPFTNETIIKYQVPATVSDASMVVYDIVGKKIVTYPLSVNGESSLKITSGDLAPGTYIYSIVGDGKVMESRRMIVSE